jgi:glycosyltransferase involved in cell wall biosynthesis
MESNYKVSVIIPVYNVEQYLDKCMESIINQTYRNLNIILVDDGSTDKSGELCDVYANKDDRIRVIHKENGGISSARNAALDIITGDYICFVDSDDYAAYNMVETLLSAALENDCEIAICGHYTEHDGNITVEEPLVTATQLMNTEEAISALIDDVTVNNYAWDKIYKKCIFEEMRFPVGRAYEDMAIMFKVFYNAHNICRIPDCLYYYQKRTGSISDHINDKRKWYKNCCAIIDAKTDCIKFLQEIGNKQLEQKGMASLIPTIYAGIRLSDLFKNKEQQNIYMLYLSEHKSEIESNPYVNKKNKFLLLFYRNPIANKLYFSLQKLKAA